MGQPDTTARPFRVLIAGGGVAGLTLLNSLQRANIDALLFEARDTPIPVSGASIGLGPHSDRILDQLEIYKNLCDRTTPATFSETWKDGKLIEKNNRPLQGLERHGYSTLSLLRPQLLQALLNAVPDKSRILTSKRVAKVDHFDDRVIVSLNDGSTYDGDVLVGADGIHSDIRKEMWRHADAATPGMISLEQQNLMKAEYICIYAYSDPHPALPAGGIYRIYGKDTSSVVLTGKNGIAHWFLVQKLDKVYYGSQIPRYTEKDATDLIVRNLDMKITDQVTLQDLFKTVHEYALLPLEEALYETWTWGRIACLGDSAHKMTPNIGQGGNAAIESAAALTNSIYALFRYSQSTPPIPYPSPPTTHPTLDQITVALQSYHDARRARVTAITDISNKMTRIEGLATRMDELMGCYVMPAFSSYFSNRTSRFFQGAERLHFLPDPERSHQGTLPYLKSAARALELGRGVTNTKHGLWGAKNLALCASLLATAVWWMQTGQRVSTDGATSAWFGSPLKHAS